MRQLLLILCLFEVLLFTLKINIAGPFMSPVIFMAVSLAIAFLYFRHSLKPVTDTIQKGRKGLWVVQILLFAGCSIYILYRMTDIIQRTPISMEQPVNSDIIPSLMHYVQRFLRGEYVYTVIPFPSYGVFPTYLPFMWMPYIPAEVFHFDYRYIPLAFFWVASLYHFTRSVSRQNHLATYAEALLTPIWPLIIWILVVKEDEIVFTHTVETLVAGYYLFLASSINNRKWWLLGIGLALCLLSRYSVIFWVPLCLAVLLVRFGWRRPLRIAGMLAAMFILIYWLPFLSKDPSILEKGYHSYTNAILAEWNNAAAGNWWHLGNGLGFTNWMYRLTPGMPVEQKLAIYQKIQFGSVLVTSALLFVYYYFNRLSIPATKFLLFSLKVYMTIFYVLVQIPYKYLMIVPVIISAALLADLGRKDTVIDRPAPPLQGEAGM